MGSIKDSKGREIPTWARHIEKVSAAGSLAASVDDSGTDYVYFGLYVPAAAVATIVLADDATLTGFPLIAGYHPIAVKSVTTTDVDIYACFPYRPKALIS